MNPPPSLTAEQRQAAREVSARNRATRKQVRLFLAEGVLTIGELLKLADDHPVIGSLPVLTALRALPGYGPARVQQLMSDASISPRRRLRGLGRRQRAELARLFAGVTE